MSMADTAIPTRALGKAPGTLTSSLRIFDLSIHRSGSISAAGRLMEMSYKRAWDLVEEMNTIFGKPVVAAQTGGRLTHFVCVNGAQELIMPPERDMFR